MLRNPLVSGLAGLAGRCDASARDVLDSAGVCLAAVLLLVGCGTPSAGDRDASGARTGAPDGSADLGGAVRRGEPSLHPPGEAAARWKAIAGPELSQLDLKALYPKSDLDQRMAFIAACDMSMRSRDASAARDAKALAALYSRYDDVESFVEALDESFELVELVEPLGPAKPPVPGGGADGTATESMGLLTGYATPYVEARLAPDERFRFPLFGDLRARFPELAASPRREILASAEARGAAIAWVDDPLLWALVETNGTAKLEVTTSRGSRTVLVSRVATNGREWTSLAKGLAARGLIPATGTTLADVARAAREHPQAAEEAALDNERLVFFAPVGSNAFPPAFGIPGARLVSGYSCAADQSVYPPGSALLVLDAAAAEDGSQRMQPRLLFVHDAGGAIRGPQRVDAYRGQGTEALLRAGELRRPVRVFRLTMR